MSSPGIRSIVRNTGYLVGARGLNISSRAVYVVALAHFLGPELYGLFAYGTSWYLALLPLASLGLDVIVSREVGRRAQNAAGLVAQTFVLRIAAALTVAVVSALLAWYVEDEALPRLLLSIFSIALVGRALAVWSEGVFIAHETAHKAFRLHLFFRPGEVVVGISVLLLGGGVVPLAIAHTLIWWTHALVSLLVVRRVLVRRPGWLPGPGMLSLLRSGIPLGLVVLMESWFLNGPILLYRHIGESPVALGQLSLVFQALMVTSVLGNVLSKASLPIVSRAVSRGDSKDRRYSEAVLRLTALVALALWLTATAWGSELVHALFGDRYAASGLLLGPAMALFYPFVGGIVLAHVLMAHGESWRLAGLSLVGIAVMAALQPALQQAFDLHGVILATGIGLLTWLLGLAALLSRRGGLRPGRSLALPLAFGAGVAALYYGLGGFGDAVAYFVAVFAVVLAVLIVSRGSFSASKLFHRRAT